jgi:4'-phosphopantetheinyl transferase
MKGIEFNISHSKEYLLVGAAEQIDIGVDIEKINDKLDCMPIAKGIFSPEEFSLFTTYDKSKQLRSFYKAWVQKEAISKALGLGLAMGFNGFDVRIDPEISQEEYEVKMHKMNACIRLSVHLETDYALAIALIEKGVD